MRGRGEGGDNHARFALLHLSERRNTRHDDGHRDTWETRGPRCTAWMLRTGPGQRATPVATRSLQHVLGLRACRERCRLKSTFCAFVASERCAQVQCPWRGHGTRAPMRGCPPGPDSVTRKAVRQGEVAHP